MLKKVLLTAAVLAAGAVRSEATVLEFPVARGFNFSGFIASMEAGSPAVKLMAHFSTDTVHGCLNLTGGTLRIELYDDARLPFSADDAAYCVAHYDGDRCRVGFSVLSGNRNVDYNSMIQAAIAANGG